MSGYPNHNLVNELRAALQRLRASDTEQKTLSVEFERIKKELPLAQEESAKAMREVMDLLTKMDCASTGNHGWQNRFVTLLMRLENEEPHQ